MPKETKNCQFCDSARHITGFCNSSMKGKYKKLQLVMLENTCPDFTSYTYKELKVMAYENPFNNNLASAPNAWTGININKKYFKREPIPITLSKPRLIRALIERWHKLRPITEVYNKGFDIDNINIESEVNTTDCPVCYEPICDGVWDFKESRWHAVYKVNTVRTKCKHHFCDSCWGRLPSSRNYFNDPHTTKSCPLCRTDNDGTDIMIKQPTN
jgi:hypothetical protein